MPPRGHALLGASSSHRWLVCTPSAKLEEEFPETTSEAAEEGTLAHAIVETKLNRIINGQPRGTATKEQMDNPLYKHAMEAHTDSYCDTVEELFSTALRHSPDAILQSEQKVDFSYWVPEGFGTTDTVIIADDTLYVIDFKYGRTVRVEAKDNPQLRLYALGTYQEYKDLYDIRNVEMYIVQPRMDGVSSDSMTVLDLCCWAEDYVRPRAMAAAAGEGETIAGEWCRFCRAKPRCRAYAEKQLQALQYEFRSPDLLSNEELADIIGRSEELSSWSKQIREYCTAAAVNGESFPGYKVVMGRSQRKITDEKKAVEMLRPVYGDSIFKLKGIGDLEDLIGRNELDSKLGKLITKPAGKPALAKDDDPRDIYNKADVFKED